MGRELKRVPMDFDWPLDQIWGGYLNPYWEQRCECPDCEGGFLKKFAARMRKIDRENLIKGPSGFSVVEAECRRAGVNMKCRRCDGEGNLWPTPEIRKQYADWTQVGPPKGDGYQIWETVSEGSPISPVFATPEELAEWMEKNGTHCDKGTTKSQWLRFIASGHSAPSFVTYVDDHGVTLKSGVQAVSDWEEQDTRAQNQDTPPPASDASR